MRTTHRSLFTTATVTVAAAATLTLAVGPALATDVDHVAALSEFEDCWKPTESPAFAGNVTEAGATVLQASDNTLVKINNAGQADTTQAHRALVDADYDWKETLPDSLGAVLGRYFEEGIEKGELPKTAKAIDDTGKKATTGKAKPHFNYPRPFMDDRSLDGTNNLRGLAKKLDIHKVADWTDPEGKKHSAGYEELLAGKSQAFPSGHTTYAYQVGLELAVLLPELGPEIVTRSSEAGNNRIVLGVHYPLDVIGGRILGHMNDAQILNSDGYVKDTVEPARKELVDFLVSKCKADKYGDTLASCIQATKANDTKGYQNAFTDAVSKKPVTDRSSAITAYASRMTYGFAKSTAPTSRAAAKVPDGAEAYLTTAFPTLSDDQRTDVIAATLSSAGDIFDTSSKGWERVNLPAAMSSKVTLSQDGAVEKVEPGQSAPSVVTDVPATTPPATPSPHASAQPHSTQARSSADPNASQSPAPAQRNDDNASGPLPRTGVEVGAAIAAAAAVIGAGGVLIAASRRRKTSQK